MSWLEALAHPTRLRIVRRLAREGSASLPELAVAADVHRNTARPHLARLEDAGVVVRARSRPQGRGRPAVLYRLREGWSPPTTDFRGLAALLAGALQRTGPDTRQLRALGRDWGRWLLQRPGAREAERELPGALEQLGFQAEVAGDEVRLSVCPCPLVSPERPELVCGLGAAVVDGVLAGAGSARRVTGAEHHPERRACTLTLGQS
jgi:predicted ArsR family transcriptional regulator